MEADLNKSYTSSSLLKQVLSERRPNLFKRVIALEKMISEENISPIKNLHNFADYSFKHANTIQANLSSMIPQEMAEPLTPFELFVLLSATLLHDVGIPLSKIKDKSLQDIKIDHYYRSREALITYHENLNLSKHEAFILSEICRAQGMPNLDYLSDQPFSLPEHGNVRVALIAAFLRLADALDISADRAQLIIKKDRILPQKNIITPKLYQSISHVKICTAPSWDIIIFATPPKKSIELALYKLRNVIQSELDTISPVLRAAGIFYKKIDLELNRLSLDKPKLAKSKSKKSKKTLKNPFILLDYFSPKEAYLFAGREKETKELFQQILDRKLTLLIGESGVGKTSLVRAGVIPKLKSFGCEIIQFSFQKDPIKSLMNALLNVHAQPHTKAELKEKANDYISNDLQQSIHLALKKRKKEKSKLIVIGDHLEQMFTVGLEKHIRDNFVLQFSQVLAELSSENINFLFCIRQDYLPDLYDLSRHIPELYERNNIFKLYNLSRENGKEALKRASKYAEMKLSDHLIERILKALCEEGAGMVYPPVLQIIGHSLYAAIPRSYYHAGLSEVPEDLYKELGEAKTILKRYSHSLLDNFTHEDKAMVGEILRRMVTEFYTKRRVAKKELESALPQCNKLESFLRTLVRTRIVRPVFDDEYELISDVIAEQVIELIDTRKFFSRPVRKALEYIENNYYKKNLTSGKVAEAAGVTQMHLATLFRNQLGRSINFELNSTRIAKAKKLLSEKRDPIAEIAESVGINDLSVFSRKFKEIVHMSPLAYRKELMSKQHVFDELTKVELD